VSAEPAAIRAEMAQTRAALTQELGQLKSLLFESAGPAHHRKGKKMPAKKAKATTAPKKESAAKKTTAGRPLKKTGTKVKKVLGEVLAGAAVGAVKGAAEAALHEAEGRKGRGEQSRK